MSNTKLLFLCAAASITAAGCGDDEGGYEPTGTGPAANVLCTSSSMNAFDTYGADAFVAVNKKIFELVTAELMANGETNVGASFGGVADFATFEGRLAAFLVFVYGGPDSITYADGKMYQGRGQDMTAAHTGMGITSEQYDYFIGNVVVPALTMSGVPMDDVSSCFAPPVTDAAFKASIVGK